MPREYLGAGTSRSGGIGSGVHGTLRVLQEISESFDRFRCRDRRCSARARKRATAYARFNGPGSCLQRVCLERVGGLPAPAAPPP